MRCTGRLLSGEVLAEVHGSRRELRCFRNHLWGSMMPSSEAREV